MRVECCRQLTLPQAPIGLTAMIRVCMAATTFPRWAGDGEGAFVWGLAHALVQQGATVRVVALHSPGAATHEVIDGVEVLRPRYWWPEHQESLRRGGGGLPVTLRDYPLARVQLPAFWPSTAGQWPRLPAPVMCCMRSGRCRALWAC